MPCESYYPGAPCDKCGTIAACMECYTNFGREMQKILQDSEQEQNVKSTKKQERLTKKRVLQRNWRN